MSAFDPHHRRHVDRPGVELRQDAGGAAAERRTGSSRCAPARSRSVGPSVDTKHVVARRDEFAEVLRERLRRSPCGGERLAAAVDAGRRAARGVPGPLMTVVATHPGNFHADDVFAVAVLGLVHGPLEIVRTRDEAALAAADFRVDIGWRSDPATGDFDHHQRGGAGERPNGIRYASFGLVWRAFGARLAGDGRGGDRRAARAGRRRQRHRPEHLDGALRGHPPAVGQRRDRGHERRLGRGAERRRRGRALRRGGRARDGHPRARAARRRRLPARAVAGARRRSSAPATRGSSSSTASSRGTRPSSPPRPRRST